MIDYKKRLTEVYEILKNLEKDDYEKIPKEILQVIEENKDNTYEWKYDQTKELQNQNINEDTIAILSYININYLLNEKQKQFMEQIHKLNEKQLEEAKKKKYNYKSFTKKVNQKYGNQ